MTLHSMRMTYSRIVPQFKEAYQQSNLFLGIFDAAIYIALGFGFLFRFVLEDRKKLLKFFLIYMTLACIGYLFIPVSSLFLG